MASASGLLARVPEEPWRRLARSERSVRCEAGPSESVTLRPSFGRTCPFGKYKSQEMTDAHASAFAHALTAEAACEGHGYGKTECLQVGDYRTWVDPGPTGRQWGGCCHWVQQKSPTTDYGHCVAAWPLFGYGPRGKKQFPNRHFTCDGGGPVDGGEAVCEGRRSDTGELVRLGHDQATCESLGCCHWDTEADGERGACVSSVGNHSCTNASTLSDPLPCVSGRTIGPLTSSVQLKPGGPPLYSAHYSFTCLAEDGYSAGVSTSETNELGYALRGRIGTDRYPHASMS